MPEEPNDTTVKIGNLFSTGQKILSAVVAIVLIISSFSVAYYQLKETAKNMDSFHKEFRESMIEIQKDTKHEFEISSETINRLRTQKRELEDQVRKDEIDQAYFKGKTEAQIEALKEEIRSLKHK